MSRENLLTGVAPRWSKRRVKAFRVIRSRSKAAAEAERIVAGQPPGSVGAKVLKFDSAMRLTAPGVKTFEVVKDANGVPSDYRDVMIRGYLSTWDSVTKSDRQGDYVERGAFTETIGQFMQNPVLLVDHRNSAESIAGSFTTVREDDKGLYVEALLSNSPGAVAKDIRFKVAENHIRTLSMGGVFYYKEDGRGIFKVSLWEGSLVAIPANPDALFTTRQLTREEMAKITLQGET